MCSGEELGHLVGVYEVQCGSQHALPGSKITQSSLAWAVDQIRGFLWS